MIKKFETFDVSKDDFEISKRSVLMLIDQLIEEYSDFTNDVSPRNWRLTGNHIADLKDMKRQIESHLTPITVEEKKNVSKLNGYKAVSGSTDFLEGFNR